MSEQTNVDPVAAAIAAAQAAAGALVAQQAAGAGAIPQTAPQGSVTTYSPPKAPSMMDAINEGLAVDGWFGVKEHGFIFGKDKVLYPEEIEVEIDLSACVRTWAVKFGNPATYLKTVDRVNCLEGGSWENALARAARVNPTAREYSSADIPVRFPKAVALKGKTLVEADSVLGYSLSTTNWNAWVSFLRDVAKANLADQTVRVKLGFEKRENKAGNIWGIVTFTLIGAVA